MVVSEAARSPVLSYTGRPMAGVSPATPPPRFSVPSRMANEWARNGLLLARHQPYGAGTTLFERQGKIPITRLVHLVPAIRRELVPL